MAGPCAVCNQPASHSCGGCKLVNYCSKDHQKIHWKSEHKGRCKALFKIERNELLGRYLVATRDIKKGELIFQEPPLVVGPKALSVPICLGCHDQIEVEKYHECDGCGFPLCSVQCQVSDHHFDECRLMMEKKYRATMDLNNEEKLQKETRYLPIVPLRCLLLKENNPEKFKKLLDLQSHLEEKIKTPLFSLYKKHVADFLRQRLNMDFDETAILKVSGILDTNAFEVAQSKSKSKLRGLYSTASMIAHNCKPNTRHTFYGSDFVIAVSATTDIAAGEIITATYTQTLWGTMARRDHLKNIKCFDCACERCSDPTELNTFLGAIRCTKCKVPERMLDGPYMLSVEPLNSNANWKCDNCGYSITGRQIKLGNESLKEELSRINKRSPEGFEDFIKKYARDPDSAVLHPKNSHVLQIKHALVQLYGNIPGYYLSELSDELLERKIDYCNELLEVVDILDPGYSIIRGQLLNELQEAMTIQAKRQFNDDRITKQAAQQTLTDAITILMEVVEIFKTEPDEVETLKERLVTLSKELDD